MRVVLMRVALLMPALVGGLHVRTMRTSLPRRSTQPRMDISTVSLLAARELSEKYKKYGEKYKSDEIDLSSYLSSDSPPPSSAPVAPPPPAPVPSASIPEAPTPEVMPR